MKRICLLFLSALLALALFACGKTSEQKWQEQYDTGIRYLSELNYEEAIVAFTAAIEAEPKNTAAYLGRAEAYVAKAKASAPPSTEIKDWPEELVALYKLAENDYLAAIGLDKELAAAYLGLADLYIEQGEMDKAREILEEGFNATGDEEIAKKQEEAFPAGDGVAGDGGAASNPEGASGSQVNEWEDEYGAHRLEFDENGNLIRQTTITVEDGITTTMVRDGESNLLQWITEWDAPPESSTRYWAMDYEGTDASGGRLLHEKMIWANGMDEEMNLAYNGDEVTVHYRCDAPEMDIYGMECSLSYTLRTPGGGLFHTGTGMAGKLEYLSLSFTEEDAQGQIRYSVTLRGDGRMESLYDCVKKESIFP